MRRPFAGLVLAALVAAAACGGSPSSGSQGPAASGSGAGSTGSRNDLEAAARAQFAAFQGRDDSSYFALLSDACRADAGFGTVSERNNGRRGVYDRAGVDLSAITVDGATITGFDGLSGSVALQLGGTGGNRFVEELANPWIYEGGAWHAANCDAFGSGGGNGEVGGSGPENAIGVGFVATIADWYVYSTYLNPNGNDLVKEGGNPDPPAGTQYFLWQVSVTYNGPDASSALADVLSFRFVAGGTTYDSPTDCGAHPGALDLSLVAGPGNGQMGDICHAVGSGDIANLFLVVREKATGTDYWFAQQ